MAEYIERELLDKALTAAAVNDKDKNRRTWAKAICILHDLPDADVDPVVHGRWILEAHDEIVGCDGCSWKGLRHQRCSCCRRNRFLKDGYTKKEG